MTIMASHELITAASIAAMKRPKRPGAMLGSKSWAIFHAVANESSRNCGALQIQKCKCYSASPTSTRAHSLMSQNCGKLPPDNPHRHLPAVDALLKQCPELLALWGHEQLTAALRAELASLRARIDAGEQIEIDPAGIRQAVAAQLELDQQISLKAVFNLTGTVLHTNLGRASLPEEAIDAVVRVAGYPSNLEFDLNTGKQPMSNEDGSVW